VTAVFFFCFFFLSGFCGLVYQVVWLRLAMADFGVVTPLVSIVLSVFMAGLALGSWAGGRLVQRLRNRSGGFFIGLYGASELAIGVSGLVVAPLLSVGRSLLAAAHGNAAWGSLGYYFASAGCVAIVMLPFCACMGATFPLAMAGIRTSRSFSYLYVANVAGALTGALCTAFVLIELIGFSQTLHVAAALNMVVAVAAFTVAKRVNSPPVEKAQPSIRAVDSVDRIVLPLLFTTGLSSLGMEVVWTRQFVPFLGPLVYSFAAILAVYLAATALGARFYRRNNSGDGTRTAVILAGFFALLPLLAADPRALLQLRMVGAIIRVVFGIGPFCAVLGFLTPGLVDRWSSGDPDRAARAYAVNALGCIFGPLVAGFLLLPVAGERFSLVILTLPFFVFALMPWSRGAERQRRSFRPLGAAAIAGALLLILLTRDLETLYPGSEVRRDHTATVIAAGRGMDKRLLVNGVGITRLTPITKMMVHLPATFLESPPKNILILCFGMGTSFRSALSWGVPVTVVELLPSVPKLFGYFHADADEQLRSPRGTVVIDDARRFLERTQDSFDIIVIDPPPPLAAAASSLLYSPEFYQVLSRRLRPGGILQQWLPGGEQIVGAAIAKSLSTSFPDVLVYRSIEGIGLHFLASFQPMRQRTGLELAGRLPPAAARDLLEWGPASTAAIEFQTVLDRQSSLQDLVNLAPEAPMLTDDRPVNEYFLLRNMLHGRKILRWN
jgi:predicted membrane-bound spermidine synthase